MSVSLYEAVVEILSSATGGSRNQWFGSPWMTAYDIAAELVLRHPELPEVQKYPAGGLGGAVEGTKSLPQYLATWLSQHHVYLGSEMEGASLARSPRREMSVDIGGVRVVATTDAVTMFRLRSPRA